MPILKVYANAEELPSVLQSAKLIEKYDAFVLVQASEAAAQELAKKFPLEDISDQYALQFGDRTLKTTRQPATTAAKRTAAKDSKKLSGGPHHYIVQFIGPIKQSWLAQVRKTGAKLREPTGNFAYVVWAKEPMLAKISALAPVRYVGHLAHSDRISSELTGKRTLAPRRRIRSGAYRVEIFAPEDSASITRAARALGFQVLSQEPKARLILLETKAGEPATRKQLQDLSEVHGVRFIRQRAIARPSNNVATKVMANDYAAVSSGGLKLAGSGEIIAVCDTGLDTGDPATIHPDFKARIVAIKSYPIAPDWNSVVKNPGADDGPSDVDSGHGTHVSGSILGNGTASAAGPDVIRGHAYQAKLVFQAIEQRMNWKPNAPPDLKGERYVLAGLPADLGPLFQYAYSQGARIHSNSWGGGDPGAYDDQCRQFDQFVWDHKDFCFVIAAGNDGTDNDGDGTINPGSVSSPGTAKNCITVGACENKRPEFNAELYGDWWPSDFPVNPEKTDPMADNPDQVVAFSSRGPTKDRRIKPEVVAPGTFILSTRSTQIAPNNFAWKAYPPNKKYFFMGGTSMATPLTAGAMALVREFLRKKQGIAKPSAALMKATLIAGAQRLPNTAPAGTILDNDQGFGRVNLDRSMKKPLCTVEGKPLQTGQKSTTSITVPTRGGNLRIAMAYTDYPGDSLVNNLNLIVTAPSGTRYTGNQKSSAAGSLALDSTNNVEVVDIASAAAGKWTIDVVASNVSPGPQDFALAAILA
ncbi:MAG: S8 family serine peptidase [Ignavibacteriota bacterium]